MTAGTQHQQRFDSSSKRAAKVLIVDDHPVVRESLKMQIGRERDLQVCGAVGSGAETMREIEAQHPDVLILDLTLPDSHGLELLKEIRALHSDVRIIVFSMHDEELFGERVLRAGAQGYMMKDQTPEQMVSAIRRVLNSKMAVSDHLAQRMLAAMATGHRNASSEVAGLSDRELEVYQMIGNGLSTKEIASQLNRSAKTIETYRLRIKGKLGIRNASELVAKASVWVSGQQ